MKQSKISKQQAAREVFMRQMSERRGHALPAALPSEFDMLPGKSESDVKLERRQKAQQLLEEVGRPLARAAAPASCCPSLPSRSKCIS